MFNDFQNWPGSKGESYREKCGSAPVVPPEVVQAARDCAVTPVAAA